MSYNAYHNMLLKLLTFLKDMSYAGMLFGKLKSILPLGTQQ